MPLLYLRGYNRIALASIGNWIVLFTGFTLSVLPVKVYKSKNNKTIYQTGTVFWNPNTPAPTCNILPWPLPFWYDFGSQSHLWTKKIIHVKFQVSSKTFIRYGSDMILHRQTDKSHGNSYISPQTNLPGVKKTESIQNHLL